jgi:hypothetical protein
MVSVSIKPCHLGVGVLNDSIAVSGYFINTTSGEPVRTEEFLNHLDLTEIKPVLMEFYCEEWRSRLPPQAMLKAMIYFKLKDYKFLTTFHNDLETSTTLARDLGFGDKIPSYQALCHFLNTRLGEKGVRKIFDAFLQIVKRELAKRMIKLGKEIGLDASPIEAPKTDKEAEYNGHYKVHGYSWHNLRCMRTDLPLDYQILFNAEVSCNIAKNWVFKKDATADEIKRWYRKMWKSDLYEKDADFMDMQLTLMATDDKRFEQVGAYWRNEILLTYEESPDGYLDDYHTRNRIEGTHGVEKRNSNIRRMEFTAGLGNTAGLC